ncbi:MAG: formylmethanofuran dehydrogenase subunit E family protein [Bacteroidales bacterium]|nr:formylmethanofuran dehydrogenase subunit E family protein [Bacteroidales bacterium]
MEAVLKTFSLPEELYQDDIRVIADACIARYGESEWKAIVLTNEIHGHLGIYSTLGAKMGIRAREIFADAGCGGEISARSFAGTHPPVSCLNDGIQIASGATPGHGLLQTPEQENPCPRAVFTCSGKSLEMCLKPVFEAIIKADIEAAVARHGHSPAYWKQVRALAIKYWKEWDRKEIFTETII